jgi:hypothetical protein
MALQLPLDIVSNTTCHGAYAAYRVSTSYTGPTMNIRRSSDNATSDFYASPHGQFGTTVNGTGTSLESWLESSTAYVVTWYDQSGKGNHATQTTTSQQPIFDSSKYRVDFTSGSPFLNLPNGTVPQAVAYTVTMKHDTIASTSGCWLGAGIMNTNQANNFRRSVNRYVNYWYANDFYGNDTVYNTGNVVTYAYDGSYNYLYINGTPQGVSPIRSGWNGQAGNEYIGRNSAGGEYFNGEMHYLFIFKSYLDTNERNHIERGMSIPNITVPVTPIKFSQIRLVMNGSTSSSISLNQIQTNLGAQTNQLINVTPFNGIVFRSGLFMRIYWNRYHGNDPTWFNSNTPNVMGVTTTLKNTYCATGGFNNPNTTDTPVGGLAATITYSVEWAGFFFAPVTGTYTFYLASDDSSYLWVGNTATSGYTTSNALINNLYTGPAEKSATISLTGGTYYPFRLQFGDGGGGQFITFSFAPPSGIRVYEGTGYFFCPSRNVSASSAYQYIIRNGSTEITTYIQGTVSSNPATSGYAIYSANPWLPDGYYWIKSPAMPNALQMFVDIKNGGFDFYQITGGTSVNYITQTHSGIALGLELMIPRSQNHWKAIYRYVHTTLASNYDTLMVPLPIYKTTAGGNYTSYAMFDPRYGNSGSTAGSYNGAPDWRCKDGGLWYLRHIPHGEPNGDYLANAFLGAYSSSNTAFLTSYGAPGFNDGNDIYYTGTRYIVSTNYAGSTLSTLTTYFDGSTFERAAPSALYIKNQTGTSTNGVYWINLPTVGPTQIYCIMDSAIDGGGWMMAMKATRGTTFPYDSGHWTTVTTLNPSDNTQNDADAKFNTMNYFPSKDLMAIWPDIPSNYNGGDSGNLLSNNISIIWANDSANNTLKIYTSTNSANVDNTHLPASYLLKAGSYTHTTTVINSSNDYPVVTLKNAADDAVVATISSGVAPWSTATGLTGSFTLSQDMRVYIHYNNNYYQYSTSVSMNLVSSTGLSTWSWLKNNYNSGTKQTLINYFSTASNVSFGPAKGVERGTAFSSQAGIGFYGVNYTIFYTSRVRWGFAWNNETSWGSNDATGGIGLANIAYNPSGPSNLSAGEFSFCCLDQTGINRSARVEMYIR